MNNIFFALFIFFVCFVNAQEQHLSAQINGINSNEGKILYTIFSGKEGFPNDVDKAIKSGKILIENGGASIEIDLPKGEYAIMVFHDEDDNDELKTNWIGMPKEGVGNSNNHKGIPSYKKSVFKLIEDKSIVIELWYM